MSTRKTWKWKNYKRGISSRTKVYYSWRNMRNRCYNVNYSSYSNYGGRGITICDEWREDLLAFVRDMGHPPGPEYSLDRIDNSKGYSKENCRWATTTEQNRNKRDTRPIEYKGKLYLVPDLAKKYGIHPTTLRSRITESGWPLEMALTVPVKKRR